MSDKKQNKRTEEQELQTNAQEQSDGEEQNSQEITSEDNANAESQSETLSAQIQQLQKERDDLKDKYLRKAAEFENYKRRTEQEFNSLTKYASEQLITDLLPVLDDFERSLNVSKERREFGPFYKGVEMIYQKFRNLLESKGVKQIDSEGKLFDVDLHDALMQIPSDEVEPNTVVEEVEKGYFYKDKVIRHAKVVVAKEVEDENNENNETTPDEQKNKESK